MSGGLPKKVVAAIEADVKRRMKANKSPWQGFGPIAEAHMSTDNTQAIVVWRQGSVGSGDGKTSFMVGTYAKDGDAWTQGNVTAADYRHPMNTRNVDEIVKKTKKVWDKEAVAA